MHLSKKIIAIFGFSCTGKTSIAAPLAQQLGIPLRSCGTVLKQKAKQLGIPISEVSEDIHRVIDVETVEWAKANAPCIVEGRFLDIVLSSLRDQIIFIKLIASDNVRCERLGKRLNTIVTPSYIAEIDNIDSQFRHQHYEHQYAISEVITLDSTELSVDECVQTIHATIKEKKQ